MKKLITIAAIFLTGLTYSQECAKQAEDDFGADPATSKKKISLYSSYLGQGAFQDAATFWWQAQKAAPKYKVNLYKNGVQIYQKLAKAAKKSGDKELTKATADTLFMIYDLWIETYGDCYEIQMKYANDRFTYFQSDYEVSYGKYKQAFSLYPEAKIRSSWVQKYFTTAYLMIKNKKLECDVLLELYDRLTGICDKKVAEDKNFAVAQKTLDKYIAPCASCDKLEELFHPKFDATPDDVKLMEKIVGMMGARKCTDSDFYMTVVEKLHSVNPTYKSAKGLALYYYNKKSWKQAISYFEQAEELAETDEQKTALCKFMISCYRNVGNDSKHISYAGKLGSGEKNAAIARVIAGKASSCGNTNVKRSFAYCLALDYAEKSGGKVSSGEMSAWKKRLPTSQDLFFEGFEKGQSVSVPCWKGEKTKTRVK